MAGFDIQTLERLNVLLGGGGRLVPRPGTALLVEVVQHGGRSLAVPLVPVLHRLPVPDVAPPRPPASRLPGRGGSDPTSDTKTPLNKRPPMALRRHHGWNCGDHRRTCSGAGRPWPDMNSGNCMTLATEMPVHTCVIKLPQTIYQQTHVQRNGVNAHEGDTNKRRSHSRAGITIFSG